MRCIESVSKIGGRAEYSAGPQVSSAHLHEDPEALSDHLCTIIRRMSSPLRTAEQRIVELGLELPTPRGPGGVYQPVILSGRLAYVSGHGPLRSDGSYISGRVGADLDVAAGRAAARQTGLAILSSLKAVLGSLDRVSRVVKLLGMVQATPEFGEHPAVINGCSELFAEIWGPDRGVGARSAVGFISLPHAIAVEIEGIFEID